MRFTSSIWLFTLLIAGCLIAVASAYLQRAGLSPIVLFSLLIGAACGAVAVVFALVFDVRNRRLLLSGTFAMSLFVVAGQHVVLHQLHLSDWRQAQFREPQLSLFEPRPVKLLDYLRQESAGGRAWLWLLDGTIVTATAVGFAAGMRKHSTPSNMEAG